MNNFEKARRRIMRRTARIIRDLRESIAMGEVWAEVRPEEKPMDIEPERVALHYALKIYNAAKLRKGPIPDSWSKAIVSALEDRTSKEGERE